MPLSSKKILLGVSGGIAAYKACDIVRRLRDQGADVHVVMTKAATQFITPLALQALSGHEVHTELFSLEQESKIGHIQLADLPDLILIAPASADLLAKISHGFCDDLLTTLLCATKSPVVLCPSMNVNMWNHPATQENLALLQSRGLEIVLPKSGSLACGYEGMGRLPEAEEIVQVLQAHFRESVLHHKKVLITAGPTWEPIDSVRHISNPSTGKAGYHLAIEAKKRGAEVVLISGPTHLEAPSGMNVFRVKTAEEMAKKVFEEFETADVMIASAAVSDFRPKEPQSLKTKKKEADLNIELGLNQDILAELGQRKKPHQILVGFAAQTHDLESEALRKLRSKKLDMICANDVSKSGIGFASDENEMTLFLASGGKVEISLSSKQKIANLILDQLESLISSRNKILKIKR